MTDGHFATSTPGREISTFIRENGYAIVDDAADTAVMDRLASEAAPFVEASAHGRDIYDGRHTRRTGALVARCPAARELVMHPIVRAVVDDFLGTRRPTSSTSPS